MSTVVWHDAECGGYEADLGLWETLAAAAGGPVLDLGCGTGRVALHLARRGHEVVGLDADADLVAAFNERSEGLPATAEVGDARSFELSREFTMVAAPMQLLHLFESRQERIACLRCAGRHLRAGGTIAVALVDGFPPELTEEAPPYLPDTREVDGWVYSSLPLDAAILDGAIVVRRLRQTVSPDGELEEELDEIPLRLLDVEAVEVEARAAGLAATGRREVPATEDHIGSTVLLLERSG
jgi:SAM-dependent methyltransferase